MKKKPKVYIINTGGTINMRRSEEGYVPVAGFVKEQMAKMTEFHHPDMPEYVIHEYKPLLDSANMRPEEWCKIAQDIADHYDEYEGFIVLHGTDTMAYTAAALSFMLSNLTKPIILTGSQIPLSEVRNDARSNLMNAMLIAAYYAIPEVCIYFDNKLLRGNRAQKINNQHFSAFDSPRFPALGKVGIQIEIYNEHLLQMPVKKEALQLQKITETNVCSFRLFPGISMAILHNLLRKPLRGLVLETYGAGNAPNNDPEFLDALKYAVDQEIVIVNCTQCQKGSVDMSHYATGNALTDYVISGYDMTPETALTKLSFLLSKKESVEWVKQQMQTCFVGELTL